MREYNCKWMRKFSDFGNIHLMLCDIFDFKYSFVSQFCFFTHLQYSGICRTRKKKKRSMQAETKPMKFVFTCALENYKFEKIDGPFNFWGRENENENQLSSLENSLSTNLDTIIYSTSGENIHYGIFMMAIINTTTMWTNREYIDSFSYIIFASVNSSALQIWVLWEIIDMYI